MKQGKVWGTTELVHKNSQGSFHLLHINKGGFCSEHRHAMKTNKFYVISGRLKISQWTEEDIEDKTILTEGQTTIIPIGIWHKFEGLTNVVCIEVYDFRFICEDIERRSVGGIK